MVDAAEGLPHARRRGLHGGRRLPHDLWHIVSRVEGPGELKPGETVLVLGAAGGVGLAAVELGKVMGAHVIAAASSDEKLGGLPEFGADETINYTEVDLKAWLKAHTDGRGVDVVYDPVGGDSASRRCAARRGRDASWSSASPPARSRDPAEPAVAQGVCDHRRVLRRARDAQPDEQRALVDELIGMLADGRINPSVTAQFPLERSAEALRELMDRGSSARPSSSPWPRRSSSESARARACDLAWPPDDSRRSDRARSATGARS